MNSSILVKEMVAKVENAKENDDKEVLITVLKQHTDTICKETFLDNNGDHQSLPDWVTVVKSQILETLSTKHGDLVEGVPRSQRKSHQE